MKHNALSRYLRIKPAILATAFFIAITFTRAAETPPKPLFPGLAPVCPCEDLAKVSLPNTTIDSAKLDPSNGWCRVTATVTHPPAGDRVKVWYDPGNPARSITRAELDDLESWPNRIFFPLAGLALLGWAIARLRRPRA